MMKKSIRLVVPFLAFAVAALLLAAPVTARPLRQDITPYEYPYPYFYPYPDEPTLETPPESGLFTPTPTQMGDFIITPTALPPVESPTVGRDLFGTEDAEMGNARVTPPASETPLPSATITPSWMPTTTPSAASAFNFNSGWFVAGVLLPPFILLIFWLLDRARRSGEFG